MNGMNGDVQRLNFFDGLRLEQRYHIELRRLLNRGLFGPGAVNGLEVAAADAHTVAVSAGLALDPLGREVVLASEQRLAVPNRPPVQKSLGGYFLTIRYGQVPAFALEGGRDIDPQHPGTLRFHVRGGRPSAVILYLRGEPFTPYYYTELGSHAHSLEKRSTADASMPDHIHDFSNVNTKASGTHGHNVQVLLSPSNSVLANALLATGF